MNPTFDFLSIKTVLSSYSWDIDKNPSPSSLITNASLLTASNTNFFGYAPFVYVSLSSSVGSVASEDVAFQRYVNFGDYYNTETNVLFSPTLSNVAFCHNYIMPGVYSIEMEIIKYTLVQKSSAQAIVYYQTSEPPERFPLSWQWYNLTFPTSASSAYNTPLTWKQTKFQEQQQLFWFQTYGPCYNIDQPNSQTSWTWNNVTSAIETNPYAISQTWNQTTGLTCTKWNDITGCFVFSSQNTLSAIPKIFTKTKYLSVIEIPPKCYLSTVDPLPVENTSPYTVQLTPRFIKSGSFPIEKIVWDLGDGSPLLTQRRFALNTNSPFVYNYQFEVDEHDPRNYDVIHTYYKTSRSQYSFYPSITAYASSTGTQDCAAIHIGPISLSETETENINLIQCELTDHGKILLGDVGNSLALWSTDK